VIAMIMKEYPNIVWISYEEEEEDLANA